jgi:hypothetical protein
MKGNFRYVIRSFLIFPYLNVELNRRRAIEQMYVKELDAVYMAIYGVPLVVSP